MAAELGITRKGESINNVVWNILGQTYRPVQLSASSFAVAAFLKTMVTR